MKRTIVILLAASIFIYGQCLIPLKPYFGLMMGANYSIVDPDDEGGNYSGMGFEVGLGAGIEFFGTIGIQVSPSFRTISFNRTIWNIEWGADYKNFYLPFQFQIRAGNLPIVSPYLGFGLAENFQLNGEAHIGELKSSIEDLENDLYFSITLGSDIKLVKLKLVPEFGFNLNLTADDPDTQNKLEKNYEFNFGFGLYLVP